MMQQGNHILFKSKELLFNTMLNLNAIYSKYYRRSFLFVKSYVQNDQIAEDIVSEAIISLWEKSKTTTIEVPAAFLMTCLKNRALNHLRQQKMVTESLEEISKDEQEELSGRIYSLQTFEPQELLSKELVERIEAILQKLPERTQLVFKLNRYEEMNYEEIAKTLHISVKGVEYHISKALKVFRENLKEYYYLFSFFL